MQKVGKSCPKWSTHHSLCGRVLWRGEQRTPNRYEKKRNLVNEGTRQEINEMKLANYIANCETGAAFEVRKSSQVFPFLNRSYNFLIIKPFDNHSRTYWTMYNLRTHTHFFVRRKKSEKKKSFQPNEMRKSISNSHCVRCEFS